MNGIIVPVNDYVVKFDRECGTGNLTIFERRMIVGNLLYSALVGEDASQEIYHLADCGIVSPEALYTLAVTRSRFTVQYLQHQLYHYVTDIVWLHFKGQPVIYSVSVESGKIIASVESSWQKRTLFRHGCPSDWPRR